MIIQRQHAGSQQRSWCLPESRATRSHCAEWAPRRALRQICHKKNVIQPKKNTALLLKLAQIDFTLLLQTRHLGLEILGLLLQVLDGIVQRRARYFALQPPINYTRAPPPNQKKDIPF